MNYNWYAFTNDKAVVDSDWPATRGTVRAGRCDRCAVAAGWSPPPSSRATRLWSALPRASCEFSPIRFLATLSSCASRSTETAARTFPARQPATVAIATPWLCLHRGSNYTYCLLSAVKQLTHVHFGELVDFVLRQELAQVAHLNVELQRELFNLNKAAEKLNYKFINGALAYDVCTCLEL